MGWWEQDKKHNENWKAWANRKYTFTSENFSNTVVDCSSLVGFRELYMVCERHEFQTGIKYRYALVVLVSKTKRGTYMVKEMDESMGPYYYNCPKRLLKKLSPVRKLRVFNNAYGSSKEWRKICWSRFKNK